jgi:DNA-binding NarL/FixJ family response regulator
MVREGLRMLVTAQADMDVVGEADNGRTAVLLADTLDPDVIVMDVSMPVMNGLKATELLHATHPRTRILALTRHTEAGYLQQVLHAGASGYVLKQSASEELVRAIRAVAKGHKYLDPAITEQAVGLVGGLRAVRDAFAEKRLSKREEEVLRQVAWGLLSKEIAILLQISIKTVEAHKANAMSKLGMKNRIDIVRYAVLHGWLQDEE